MAETPEPRIPALIKSAGRWVNYHRSGTFAALTFAISVSLALFFGLANLSEPDPEMTYEILREIDVLDVRTPVEDLKITFQNEDIQGENLNLRIYAMRVVNNGEVDILQTQYDQDQVWGLRVIDGRVIETRLIESSSSYLSSKANPQVVQEDIVEFDKAIVEKGQFFAFNMLVVHAKDDTPKIIPLGKIAGIDEIVVTRKPVEVKGPRFLSDLFAGGWTVQLARAILFLLGAAVVLGLFAAAVLSFSFLTAALRRRIGNSVVIKTMTSQKQLDLLSEVYLNHGMTGVRDLREKLGSSERLELEVATLGTVVLAGESEFRIPPAYYSAASLEEAEALSRMGGNDSLAVDPLFQERLGLFLQEMSTSHRIF